MVYLFNLEGTGSSRTQCERLGEDCIPPATEIRDYVLEQANGTGLCVTESKPVYALNYSNGDPVHFVAYRFDAGEGCEF